ncbi:MAG TPA: YceI family protein [Gammaproteobacteria bacterium]|nr:YceI family protein [Gammaproteobacteria bacterium]
MKRLALCLSLLLLWAAGARAACWKPVPSPKSLTFTASQGGAPFPGEFKSYTAELCLGDKDPAQDKLRVDVDLNSVDSGLDEMDAALKNDDFFDTAKYPRGSFVSDSLKQVSPGHYSVTGKLTLKGITKTITVPFTWTPSPDGKHARLDARTTLQRRDFGIGKGQWDDPQYVGLGVDVVFAINFVPAP